MARTCIRMASVKIKRRATHREAFFEANRSRHITGPSLFLSFRICSRCSHSAGAELIFRYRAFFFFPSPFSSSFKSAAFLFPFRYGLLSGFCQLRPF